MWKLGVLIGVLLGGLLVVGACGKVDDGSSGGDASASDGGAASDGAPGDGAASSDAGSTSDGAAPGILCNGVRCDASTQNCCIEPGNVRCVDDTVSSCSGDRRKCMMASDCGGTNVCCSGPTAAAPPRFYLNSTMCASSCPTNMGYQICDTDAECQNGQGCKSQTCGTLGVVKVCGSLPASACQ